jgi:hypothetical protein
MSCHSTNCIPTFFALRAPPSDPHYNNTPHQNIMLMGLSQYYFSDYWWRCCNRSPMSHPQYLIWPVKLICQFIFFFFPLSFICFSFPGRWRSKLPILLLGAASWWVGGVLARRGWGMRQCGERLRDAVVQRAAWRWRRGSSRLQCSTGRREMHRLEWQATWTRAAAAKTAHASSSMIDTAAADMRERGPDNW